MISSEVQRTLVKSPPELWTELSDPESLARHLGELGDIRITHVEPEQLVEWEAEGTSGKVQIKASGWGTKVTLSVSRDLPAEQPASIADVVEAEPDPESSDVVEAAQPEPLAEAADPPSGTDDGEPAIESVPQAAEATQATPTSTPDLSGWSAQLSNLPETMPDADPTLPSSDAALRPEAETRTEQMPRRGFFARLFGGRRRTIPAPEEDAQGELEPLATAAPAGTSAGEPKTTEQSVKAETQIGPKSAPSDPAAAASIATVEDGAGLDLLGDTDQESQNAQPAEGIEPADGVEQSEQAETAISSEQQAPDLAAELRAAEETAAEEVRAMLVAVLDRLGAAHHRPFSRS
jgi:hypothetical protein